MGDYPGLSRRAPQNHEGLYKRLRGGGRRCDGGLRSEKGKRGVEGGLKVPHASPEGGGRAPGKESGTSSSWRRHEGLFLPQPRKEPARPTLGVWASALQDCTVINVCCLSHQVCHHLSRQQQEMNTLTLGLHTLAHAPPGPPDLPGGTPLPSEEDSLLLQGRCVEVTLGSHRPSGQRAAQSTFPAGSPGCWERREPPSTLPEDRGHSRTALCSPRGRQACSEHVPRGDFSE